MRHNRYGPGAERRRLQSRRLVSLFISVALAGIGLTGAQAQDSDAVARGRYLATLGECGGCHRSDKGPFGGGAVFHTKFGAVAAANISPDDATGIGTWSADDFYRALHKGRSKNGAHLYPAFPYPYFTKVAREDSDSLYAYLRTVAPVSNAPRRNQLAFPFSIRGTMVIWNALFFREGTFRPDPGQSTEWNRGAYIVQSLAHCGACHSPKNFLEADSRSRPYQGGMIEGWFAPNLTADPRTGLCDWSHEDLVRFLQTGRNRATAAGGLMANVVQGSVSHFQDADVAAVATYIKSLPPSPPPRPVKVDPAVMDRGQAVYAAHCASCHDAGASGEMADLPPLKGSPHVQAANPTTLIRYTLSGTRTATTAAFPKPLAMPGYAAKLDDQQTAEVLTYVRNAWGNTAPPVKPDQVAKVRAKTVQAAG